MSDLLSDRIAELRKERGLTQEQLGQLVGVSAQAVSKWEKGGAPDVELLPALADRLGVTIDNLFGRSDQEIEDMPRLLARWLDGIPLPDRVDELFQLLAATLPHLCAMSSEFSETYLKAAVARSCYALNGEWMRSVLNLDGGFVLSVLSNDFPLYMLLPEPPAGYASQFSSTEEYRRLFSLLGKEGCLELLYYLEGQNPTFYTAAALAKHTGLPQEQVAALLDEMCSCNLMACQPIELESGSKTAYELRYTYGLVPFLYVARWLTDKSSAWNFQWFSRGRPILVPPEKPEKEAPHEPKA